MDLLYFSNAIITTIMRNLETLKVFDPMNKIILTFIE